MNTWPISTPSPQLGHSLTCRDLQQAGSECMQGEPLAQDQPLLRAPIIHSPQSCRVVKWIQMIYALPPPQRRITNGKRPPRPKPMQCLQLNANTLLQSVACVSFTSSLITSHLTREKPSNIAHKQNCDSNINANTKAILFTCPRTEEVHEQCHWYNCRLKNLKTKKIPSIFTRHNHTEQSSSQLLDPFTLIEKPRTQELFEHPQTPRPSRLRSHHEDEGQGGG